MTLTFPTSHLRTDDSIAKAFDAHPLEYHDETLRRMTALTKRRANYSEQTEEMITARKRMALFPKNAEVSGQCFRFVQWSESPGIC